MNEIAISVNNLSKKYHLYDSPQHRLKEALHPFRKKYHRDFWALRDVSFEVKKGETIGIIGKNGSGKSTLLQVLCGILQPSEGEVRVNGRISALLELGAGFNPEFTGRQNVYMNSALMGLSREDVDIRFDDIAAFADIGEFIDQPVKTYSSGMYVRLAFAAAINVDPEILIVDEALAVGDTQFVQKCLRKFEEFKEQGVTILFVSHDVTLIKKNCQEALLMEQGEVIDRGEPKEIIDVYNAILFENIAKEMKAEKVYEPKEIVERRVKGASQKYGTGQAEIIDAALLNSKGVIARTIMSGEEGIIRIKAKINAFIKDMVFGITIRDRKGLDMYGVNTLWKKVKLDEFGPGDIVIAEFRQKMNLARGEYHVNVAINENKKSEGLPRLAWMSDLVPFNVITDEDFLGFCNLDSDISVRIEKNGTAVQ